MRTFRISIILVVLLIFVAGITWLAWPRRATTNYKLSDGTILHVDQTSFGQRDRNFVPTVGWMAEFKKKMAKVIPAKLLPNNLAAGSRSTGSWWQNIALHSNLPALHIWMTHRSAGTQALLSVGQMQAEIIDEHGCVFRSSQNGGENFGLATGAPTAVRMGSSSYDDTWFTFEAFPRRQKSFVLRVWDTSTTNIAEFQIANPAPLKTPEKWVTSELPIAKKVGDLTITLAEVVIRSNTPGRVLTPLPYFMDDPKLEPKFEFSVNGRPTREWSAEMLELADSSGNFAPGVYGLPTQVILCNREEAWKLTAKFFADDHTQIGSNVSWTMRGLKVPGAGEITSMMESNVVSGVPIFMFGLCGPGQVTFSNGLPIENVAVSNTPAGPRRSSSNSGRNGMVRLDTITSPSVQVGVRVPKMNEEQRLTIRAIDDQHREFYAEAWGYGGTPNRQPAKLNYLRKDSWEDLAYCSLRLPADAKTIDLIFCVHDPVTEEFIFKPPQN